MQLLTQYSTTVLLRRLCFSSFENKHSSAEAAHLEEGLAETLKRLVEGVRFREVQRALHYAEVVRRRQQREHLRESTCLHLIPLLLPRRTR